MRILPFFLVAIAFLPARASACGGLFCNGGTPTMPVQQVDQAGEDIAYLVEGDGSLTMIVRILYEGRSDNFAWILPVPVMPDAIELGPEALFEQLATATGPQFQLGQTVEGRCRSDLSCDFPSRGCDLGCVQYSPDFAAADAGAFPARDGGGVVVVSEGTVGAYETVVLSGGTAEELHAWLTDHAYDIPTTSIPVIADYVAARQLFVALRLRSGASTDAIQPIALRMAHEQPCLPIRLTAIATVPDLPIRAYFVGDAPFAPSNYSLLDPPLSSAVFQVTVPWTQRWSDAIDDAGGHAFVRDFAGPPPPVDVAVASLDALRGALPAQFFNGAIALRGYPREAVIAVAGGLVTPPDGVELAAWIDDCTSGGCEAPVAFDADALVDALHAQVRDPFGRFQRAFDEEPWLTRLYTTLDAAEMTLDPEFRADAGLEAQSNLHTATLVTECHAGVYIQQAGQRIDMSNGETERVREENLALSADAICRSMGGTGASGGCAAHLGRGARPGMAVVLVVLALVLRRARRG